MDYTYKLSAEQEAVMDAKADLANETIAALLDARLVEYIEACARDVGADDLAKVTKELSDPAKLATAKAALGL